MMGTLMRRAAQLAEREQTVLLERVAEDLRDRFESGAVEVTQTGVHVSARGLVRRWLSDPAVRFIGAGR